jgi:hypothetical protein
MSIRMPFPCRAIGLSVLLCVAPPALGDESPRPAPRPPARLYTNADLDRVHPFAAETGVRSIPAVAPGDTPEAPPREARPRGRGEQYWRSEAARVRERLRAHEERAASLHGRIAEQARQPEVFGKRRPASGASAASLQASLAAVERRIQRTRDDLEERARRDGALPGWLR